ncbi:ankyrin [Mollisia scopiformis]|uniref:Ankyrin n=1 Tax=Mollisia scopiformis TaxID=149040 RepID=A0A194WUL8_MOLSC|nr:ankyrin [Mollisia scopiformis]KUJ11307.1 ankyrin [Mollisia scopiformis]
MRTRHENIADPASKKSVRHYYQISSNEGTTAQSEEAVLKLLVAVSEADETSVQEMISAKVDLYGRDSTGRTAGDIAATKGHLGVMQLLIGAGINVNFNKTQPWLYQALKAGKFETAKCLLKAGAFQNATTHIGGRSSTIFGEMLVTQSSEAVELLQKHRNENLLQPLGRLQELYTRSIGKDDSPRTLQCLKLMSQIEPNLCGGDTKFQFVQTPPLHIAAATGAVGVASFILDLGADVEAKSKAGDSPLILAIKSNHLPMVKLLLGRGASLHAISHIQLHGPDDFMPPMPLMISPSRIAMIRLIFKQRGLSQDEQPLQIPSWRQIFICQPRDKSERVAWIQIEDFPSFHIHSDIAEALVELEENETPLPAYIFYSSVYCLPQRILHHSGIRGKTDQKGCDQVGAGDEVR